MRRSSNIIGVVTRGLRYASGITKPNGIVNGNGSNDNGNGESDVMVLHILKSKDELYERMLALSKEKETLMLNLTKEFISEKDKLTKEKDAEKDKLTKEKDAEKDKFISEKDKLTKEKDAEKDKFISEKEKVIRLEQKHQRVANELLATQGKLNLRGALEFVRFKQVPNSSYKTPWSEAVSSLKRDKSFISLLNKCCAKSGSVQPKDAEASLPGLYSHASGQLHGVDEGKIAISKRYWNPGQRLALSAILRHHDLEFVLLNEDGSEEEPPC